MFERLFVPLSLSFLSLSLILLSRACKKREHVFRNVVEA